MGAHLSPVGKHSRGLDGDIDAELLPRQTSRVFLIQDDDVVPVDAQDAFADFDLAREDPIGRVVTKQVRVGIQFRHVVYGDDG